MALTGIWSLILDVIKQIDKDDIEPGTGIHKYHAFRSHVFDKDVSIGVSRESGQNEWYIFCLFIGDERIDIDGVYRKNMELTDKTSFIAAMDTMVKIFEARMDEHKKAKEAEAQNQ